MQGMFRKTRAFLAMRFHSLFDVLLIVAAVVVAVAAIINGYLQIGG